MSETGQRVQNMVFIVHIEGVGEVIWLAIDVGPQRHSFTVHFLKTEIKLENVSIGTSLVHQKQNYYYSPFQCSHCGTCLCHSLLFAVVKECTKQTAVEVIQDSDEEELIKLEGSGKLRTHCEDIHSEFQNTSIHFMGIHRYGSNKNILL